MSKPELNADDTPNSNNSESQNQTIDWEKRYKDLQGDYQERAIALKQEKAKVESLEKLTTPRVELDKATKDELDNLKFSDPDAWYAKKQELEMEALNKHKEAMSQVTTEAQLAAELERRTQVLADFNASHKLNISDETIQFDVPPRITKKLESGEITFEQFLQESAEFLKAPKVVGDGNNILNQPNLGNVGGDNTPTNSAISNDIAANYNDIVY